MLEVLVAVAALMLAWQLLGCYWHGVPAPRETVCVSTAWPSLSTPWLLLSVAVAVLILTAIAAAVTMRRNLKNGRAIPRTLLGRRVPSSNSLQRIAERSGLERRVAEVVVNSSIAETYGLLSPRVIISTGLLERLDDRELYAVLVHEAEHVRRRDPLRLAVMRTAAAATFPFPVLRQLAEYAALDTELRADRKAASHAGRVALAGALKKVLDSPTGGSALDDAAGSGIHGLRERVRYLGDDTEPRISLERWHVAVSGGSLAILAVLVTLLTRALAASYLG